MAIDTLRWYHPLQTGVVYIKLGFPRHNDYKVGETYEMRIADNRGGGSKAYEYPHEAVLVGKEKYIVEDMPNILLATLSNRKSKSDALEILGLRGEPLHPDDEVYVLTFIRTDKAKELVLSDIELIPDKHNREDHYA